MGKKRQPGRRGLLGGLVLLSFGILFLLQNLGWIEDFWGFVGRYWPLLLVLMGMAKIVEYLRGTGTRLLGFGEFLLILCVMGFGLAAARLPIQLQIPFGNRRVSVSDYYGDSFTFTEEKSQSVQATPRLKIRNAQGDITLVPGIDGRIRVRLRKVIYAGSERQASDLARRIQLVIASEGENRWRIETTRSELGRKAGRFETFFEISVPKSMIGDIINHNGDVRLEGLTGNQKVATSYGLLSLRQLTGNIEGNNKYGETRVFAVDGDVQLKCLHGEVWVERITGNLGVANSYAPVEVSDVQGTTTIANSYSSVTARKLKQRTAIASPGSMVSVEGVEGDLEIRSSHKEVIVENSTSNVELYQEYGSVRVTNIGGDLIAHANYAGISGSRIGGSVDIDGTSSDITLEDVRGNTVIQNKYKPVTLIDFGGSVSIRNENGAVSLETSSLIQQPITATTTYGDLELSLPANSSFQLEARTRDGDLVCEFSGPEEETESGDIRILRGTVGEKGPLVKLETEFSNVSIRKSSGSR